MSESLDGLSLAQLCAPIDGGSGEDLSFSTLFDQIKEARRADPDYLSQGDWQADLKVANWDLTIELAAKGLTEHSKDLMLAAWLAEGVARKYHFVGVAFGLRLIEKLAREFWPVLFPSLEEGMDLRTSRLAWLNTALIEVVSGLPITGEQGYGLARYEESRYVENLALQNPDSMAAALQEGKINAEIFHRSAVQTDSAHLQAHSREIGDCLVACRALQATLQALLAQEAPSFKGLEDTLARVGQLVARLLKERGIDLAPAAQSRTAPALCAAGDAAFVDTALPALTEQGPQALRTVPLTRDEAFNMLAGVAQFIKQTEPHSPVPYLLERAIKWGQMPLESWLAEVIKDGNVVDGIKDLLGTKGAS